ncbi:MAG: 30S ribosomal protein S19 [Nanoarchaeota archaeon]
MKKELFFRGKTMEDLGKLNTKEIMPFMNSRQRRSLKRGNSETQKKFLVKVKKYKEGKLKKPIKTHCREMIVLPEMVGILIQIYNGKDFSPVEITYEMIGHYLGEFAMTRRKVEHSAPGIGATKSSAAMSVK